MKILILVSTIVVFACNQPATKKNEQIENAKWHFYANACSSEGYLQNQGQINPLECEIKLMSIIKVNSDTTKAYFNLYYKDTMNVCVLKPGGLIGIAILKNKFFLPIYHTVVYESFGNDSLTLAYMHKQETLLHKKIKESKGVVSEWLRQRTNESLN